MLRKVLIANRGEIACRIMRTAQLMGIETVAVYSDADRDAIHAMMADQAVHIGPGPATESYLRIDKIVAAAEQTGADSVHPGYGFLAENPDFADACKTAGLVFVGPSSRAMRALGGKAEAKELAIAAGVPVVPGYQGGDQDADLLQDRANAIGYPVMIKAVSGGGGRGMRLVTQASQFQAALESAQREASAAFGDARVLIEKFVEKPRHIEVQVFGDSRGNVVHLFERDCTLQRRNQKVVEEAPAPGMSSELRQAMTSAAVQLARSVGYEGAGTVEFLVEGGELGRSAPWYFIEMNTRLQVEHPVTEAITGLDLVEWQFLVAGGEPLPLEQDDIAFGGHAIEVRLCAEDPAADFAPSTGKIVEFDYLDDEGLRIESGVEAGSVISPYYDSMIAKIIRVDVDRDSALEALRMDLEDVDILGLKTNLAFLHALLGDEAVDSGDLSTSLIAERLPDLVAEVSSSEAVAAGVHALLESERLTHLPDALVEPWASADAFQLGGTREITRKVQADGVMRDVSIAWQHDRVRFLVDGEFAGSAGIDLESSEFITADNRPGPLAVVEDGRAHVFHDLHHVTTRWPVYDVDAVDEGDAGDTIRAPINGRVAQLFVGEGDAVAEGDSIAVVEAMKMEHVLACPRAGTIDRLHVGIDAQVTAGTVIASLVLEKAE